MGKNAPCPRNFNAGAARGAAPVLFLGDAPRAWRKRSHRSERERSAFAAASGLSGRRTGETPVPLEAKSDRLRTRGAMGTPLVSCPEPMDCSPWAQDFRARQPCPPHPLRTLRQRTLAPLRLNVSDPTLRARVWKKEKKSARSAEVPGGRSLPHGRGSLGQVGYGKYAFRAYSRAMRSVVKYDPLIATARRITLA